MTKAKIASKNNPTTREKTQEYTYNNKKIKPVKLITQEYSFIAAEYEDSGDLVMGVNNKPLTWNMARSG